MEIASDASEGNYTEAESAPQNTEKDNNQTPDERKAAIAADWCKVIVDGRSHMPEDSDLLTHYYHGLFLMRALRGAGDSQNLQFVGV